MDLREATSEPGIRVAEYCLVVNQWSLLLWTLGDDTAPRSCRGLREKTPSNFLQRVVEKLSNAFREGRLPKKSRRSARLPNLNIGDGESEKFTRKLRA